jgi:hypothetical protein
MPNGAAGRLSVKLGRTMPVRRALSVQSKLIGSFVLITLAGVVVLTGVGYVTARQSLTAAAERQLLSLQRSKAGNVKSILASMRNEALAFSAAESVVRAARDTRSAYRGLSGVAVTPEMDLGAARDRGRAQLRRPAEQGA